jgi:hypothetical protein
MPRKPHCTIFDHFGRDLSSLARKSREIRGETKESGIFFVSMRAENFSGLSGFLDA